MKRLVLTSLLCLLALTPAAAQDHDQRLLDLLAEDLDAAMRASPTWASMRGDRRFDTELPDPGAEARAARRAATKRRLAALAEIDRTKLTEANRVNAALFEYELKQSIAGERFEPWQQPISQLGGPQRWIPQLPERLTLVTDEHRLNYVLRLEKIPAYLEQIMANMRAGLEAGRTPPRIIMGEVAAQALAHAAPEQAEDPTTSAFYAPFSKAAPDDPTAKRAREVIRAKVVPAFRALGEFLRDTYVPACRDSIAAGDGKDGPAFYAHRLRAYTTTDASAEEIHALGLKEVARIREEMFAVIARCDFEAQGREGDVLFAAFVEFLRSDPRFYHQSAQALVDGYRALAKRIDAELPALFRKLPRNPYGVREMPAFIAPTSPTAYYYSGSLKNGKPGYFVANTHKLDQRPRYEMIPLTLHEAVPGHHLQIALAQELQGVPKWRTIRGYTVFVEGWALYAERLGLEMGEGERGLYEDPYDDFGRLSYEMWRAMRLVVDTGIHALGWPRERAIAFMLANSALTAENVEREVDRYISWPGQAVAYKVGELKIRALRAKAEATLGESFDIRPFHDVVLGQGALPLGVLEERVEAWIARAKASSQGDTNSPGR